jgi:hypothetical protein
MVMDVIEDAIPVVMDIVEDAMPAAVDAVTSAPTVIMDAIRIDTPKAEKPAPAAPEAPAERPAAAFVTETMAQLYLEQGHRAEAIEIYKQLVAARPGDAELRGRLEAIERGAGLKTPQTTEVAGGVPASPASRASEPAAAPATRRFAASGPTIRTVLRELFGIEGQSTNGSGVGAAAGGGGGNGAGDGEMGSIDTLFSAESVPEDLGPLASAFDGGYVAPSGSIDAVFASGGR